MAVCRRCGRPVDEDSIVCKNCGATLKFEKWDAREVLYYYGPLQRPIGNEKGKNIELLEIRKRKIGK